MLEILNQVYLTAVQRMMALNLPALASELAPPPKQHTAATAKHKGW
jgi:hypothetical protein